MNLEMSNELFIILYRFFRLRKVCYIFIASPGRRIQVTDSHLMAFPASNLIAEYVQ